MKTHALSPYVPPVVEKPTCASCKVFSPDCLVPHGAGAIQMCWLCAHQHVDHEVAVPHAYAARCSCTANQIFPASVLEAREKAAAEGAAAMKKQFTRR